VKLAAAIRKISNASLVAMTQQFALPDETPSHNPQYGDTFVVFSVTVLSCAAGAWLLLRLGVALWVSSVAALGVYAALLSFHLLVRRSMMGAVPAAAPPAARRSARRTPPFPQAPILRPEAPALAPRTQQPPPPPEPPRGAEPPGSERRRPTDPLSPTRTSDPFMFRPSREPSLSAPPLPGFAPKPAPAAGEPRTGIPPAAPEDAPPEMRVELVQELIKKLADELNTATATTVGERAAAPPARAPDPDAMINRSVDALEATARGMHARGRIKTPTGAPQPDVDASGKKAPAWRPTPATSPGPVRGPAQGATPPQLNPQIARIAEAVAAERMEVLLEPIHALIEGRPRHFEVSTRLLTADGTAIDPREYAPAARGSGLMPRIDAAKMIRAARVAGRLGQRGREGSVLASMTGDSLTDQAFLEAAAAGPRGAAGMGLVLSFAQSEVRAFTPGHARALSNLAALGLRFALEEVTDLDMDFAALKGMGFAFVELAAPVFLDGLPAAGGLVPAADICRHLANFGLALIVGRIDDDWLLARILGFGVLYGKGALFGGPRLVKDEVVAPSTAA
jgi:cyclic-di-GMP phosphodiesterase, flagellum assembly factor TipF